MIIQSYDVATHTGNGNLTHIDMEIVFRGDGRTLRYSLQDIHAIDPALEEADKHCNATFDDYITHDDIIAIVDALDDAKHDQDDITLVVDGTTVAFFYTDEASGDSVPLFGVQADYMVVSEC